VTGKIGTFALGIATGGAIGYLLDPDRGRSRRAQLSDQTKSQIRTVSESLKSRLEYQRGVARGIMHDLTEPLGTQRHYTDDTLLQKVRSEALGYWDHEGAIDVDIRDGLVVLTGRVDSEAGRDRLIELIRAVDGVGLIDDRVDISGAGQP
jgi:osmotically-inducible protein OsmY